MSIIMCPGQNTAFWRPGDIFEIICPVCEGQVEFFKDDSRRRCPSCGHVFANPKLNQGCAKWCKFADKCLGLNPEIINDADLQAGGDEKPGPPDFSDSAVQDEQEEILTAARK